MANERRCIECKNVVTENRGTEENPLCPMCYNRMMKDYGGDGEGMEAGKEERIALKALFFSFRGRIGIGLYWLGSLILTVVSLTVTWLILGAMFKNGTGGAVGFYALIAVFMIWPFLAINIKRLHDRNKAGIWMLIYFIPVAGSLWLLIECGFLTGTYGRNRYGNRRNRLLM